MNTDDHHRHPPLPAPPPRRAPVDAPGEADEADDLLLPGGVDHSVAEDVFGLLLEWRYAVLRGERL